MNKAPLLSILAGFALNSCAPIEPNVSRSIPAPASPRADLPIVAPTVAWAPVELTGGGQQINVSVNGREYFLKHGESFEPQPPAEYLGLGIPAKAMLAALYWDENAEEESGSKMYAIVEGHKVVVYVGSIAPGDMQNVDWIRFKSIPF